MEHLFFAEVGLLYIAACSWLVGRALRRRWAWLTFQPQLERMRKAVDAFGASVRRWGLTLEDAAQALRGWHFTLVAEPLVGETEMVHIDLSVCWYCSDAEVPDNDPVGLCPGCAARLKEAHDG